MAAPVVLPIIFIGQPFGFIAGRPTHLSDFVDSRLGQLEFYWYFIQIVTVIPSLNCSIVAARGSSFVAHRHFALRRPI